MSNREESSQRVDTMSRDKQPRDPPLSLASPFQSPMTEPAGSAKKITHHSVELEEPGLLSITPNAQKHMDKKDSGTAVSEDQDSTTLAPAKLDESPQQEKAGDNINGAREIKGAGEPAKMDVPDDKSVEHKPVGSSSSHVPTLIAPEQLASKSNGDLAVNVQKAAFPTMAEEHGLKSNTKLVPNAAPPSNLDHSQKTQASNHSGDEKPVLDMNGEGPAGVKVAEVGANGADFHAILRPRADRHTEGIGLPVGSPPFSPSTHSVAPHLRYRPQPPPSRAGYIQESQHRYYTNDSAYMTEFPRTPRQPRGNNRNHYHQPADRHDNDREQIARVNAQLLKARDELAAERANTAALRATVAAEYEYKSDTAFATMMADLFKKQMEVVEAQADMAMRERDLAFRVKVIQQIELFLSVGQKVFSKRLEQKLIKGRLAAQAVGDALENTDVRSPEEENARQLINIEREHYKREVDLKAVHYVEEGQAKVKTQMEHLRLEREALELREKQYKATIRSEVQAEKIEAEKNEGEKTEVEKTESETLITIDTPQPQTSNVVTHREPKYTRPLTLAAQLRGPVPMHNGSPILANHSAASASTPVPNTNGTKPEPEKKQNGVTSEPAEKQNNIVTNGHVHHANSSTTNGFITNGHTPANVPTTTAATASAKSDLSFIEGYAACHRAHALMADLRAGRIPASDPRLAFLFDAGHPENPLTMFIKMSKLSAEKEDKETVDDVKEAEPVVEEEENLMDL